MYMRKEMFIPDLIFESSWEVCNKVGGIYTVLSTRAKTLQGKFKDNVLFIGPDLWKDEENPSFVEDGSLLVDWKQKTVDEGLKIKIGRWKIPGHPITILVDFSLYNEKKNDIYTWLWENYQVDSLHAYGDYDEASMFSYAAAKVVESFYNNVVGNKDINIIYHGNEWMTGLGLLYINKKVPQIATMFTTHATSIGRSIAGNNKPLYDYLSAYNGDQMACELNMQSKHSIEKQTAKYVDCFTTVSDITANECKDLLDKSVDVVLPNGFENSFVPKGNDFLKKRSLARKRMLKVANALTGKDLDDNTLIVSTSGRYEFRNKGIDVFIEAINRLRGNVKDKKILAFIDVPAWVGDPRADLLERMNADERFTTPLKNPFLTHWLHNMDSDNVVNMLKNLGLNNSKEDDVNIIFVPCYLTGDDGIFNVPYYDVILGNDLCIYPSYYEPWGYTPLEAIAFKVPCITTDLAGFGLWINSVNKNSEITDGVKVIHRTDSNYSDVAEAIKNTIIEYIGLDDKDKQKARNNAKALSEKALWCNFIKYYDKAYSIALEKEKMRNKEI